MEIVFHSHHAAVSDRMRQRAVRAVEKLAQRLSRVGDAVIRFESDGPARRVEIALRASRRRLIAIGEGRYFGPALAQAVEHLQQQLPKKNTPKARARLLAKV